MSEKIVIEKKLEEIIALLERIADNNSSPSSLEVQSATQQIITEMRSIHIDNVAEKVHDQEWLHELLTAGKDSDEKKIRQMLSDGNAVAGAISNLVKFAKTVALFY